MSTVFQLVSTCLYVFVGIISLVMARKSLRADAFLSFHEAAAGLLDELGIGARWVRLVGVSVSNLTHNAFQLTLDEGWREVALSEAVDKVRDKYGFKSLKLAGGALTDRRLAHPSPGLAFQPPDA